MAHPEMPSIAEVNTAADALDNIAACSNNPAGAIQEARQVMERARAQRVRYLKTLADGGNTTALVFADAADADLGAFLVGGSADAILNGDAFSVADADDTTDNALQAAKGSAVANKDVFQRLSDSAVKYLGATDAAFTTMDASLED